LIGLCGNVRLLLELLIGRYRISGIYKRRTAAHIDGHSEGFLGFLTAGAEPNQGLGMKADAAVAARGGAKRGMSLRAAFSSRRRCALSYRNTFEQNVVLFLYQ
jgi:hypothetical protein